MAPALLALLIFGALALALFLAGVALCLSSTSGVERLRGYLGLPPRKRSGLADKLEVALAPAAKLLPASEAEASSTRSWLIQAGFGEARHVRLYFGLRAVMVLVGIAVVLLTGLAAKSPLLLIAIPALGYVMPRFLLRRRVAQRSRRIRASLPDTLDLLVICVEAGMGLDQAVQRVAQELKPLHPDLCAELDRMGLELSAGVPRREALQHVSERCAVEDLRSLSAALIQTDRFGTSIGQALRAHAQGLRVERRQRLEEEAAKLSIKMLPVLALFIFPAVMIVVLGPAVITLIRHLGPMLAH